MAGRRQLFVLGYVAEDCLSWVFVSLKIQGSDILKRHISWGWCVPGEEGFWWHQCLSRSFLPLWCSAEKWPTATQEAVLTRSHQCLYLGCHNTLGAKNKCRLSESPGLPYLAMAAHTQMVHCNQMLQETATSTANHGLVGLQLCKDLAPMMAEKPSESLVIVLTTWVWYPFFFFYLNGKLLWKQIFEHICDGFSTLG